MGSFTDLLENIHASDLPEQSPVIPSSQTISDADAAIIINEKREFQLPDNFNTIIAYEGDINSQIISFSLPKSTWTDGHLLNDCKSKKVLWRNLASGVEGSSDLIRIPSTETKFWSWEVPPSAFTKAG